MRRCFCVWIASLFIISIYVGNWNFHNRTDRGNNHRSLLGMDDLDKGGLDDDIIVVSEKKVKKLKVFFEKHSSLLASHSGILVYCASKYGFDYRLLPSILMVESSGCKNFIRSTNNCFGWSHGTYRFASIQDSIVKVSKWIATAPQFKKFQETGKIEDLGEVYAEDKGWAEKVKYFMKEIERGEK